MSDVRFALRQIARRPGLAALIVATLALGIGANTAIFSAIEAAILRPPPYPTASELRILRPELQRPNGTADTLTGWSYPMFEAFREADPALGDLAAYTPEPGTYNLETTQEPERVRIEFVSATYFPLLGLRPAVGRFFVPEEDRVPREPAIAVLSHETWTSRYGADSSVVGRVVRINTIPFTVVGIARPGFRGLSDRADLWVPMMMAPVLMFPSRLTGELSFWHAVVGRIPAHHTETLSARLDAKAKVVESQIPLQRAFQDASLGFVGLPLANTRVHPAVRSTLRLLMGVVALVLLLVCVNIGSLLLTQARRRQQEVGIRVALGAAPRHLARIFLAEALLLSLMGGVAALLVATWLLDLVGALAPPLPAGTADPASAGIGSLVLLFNFGVALLAGLLVGVPPAIRVRRAGPQAIMMESPRTTVAAGRARRALIATEVGLALTLVTGAGLLLRSLQHLRSLELGFEPTGLLTAGIALPRQAYNEARVIAFLQAARERVGGAPGVRAASIANCLPISGGCDMVGLEIKGRPAGSDPAFVTMNMVDGGYFQTLGIRLLAGRTFDGGERSGTQRVAILSQEAARQFWPGENPLGTQIQLTVGWEDFAEVIGVVGDVPTGPVGEPPAPVVYLPYSQGTYDTNYLVVRADQAPLALGGQVRRVVQDLDPLLPLWELQTMEERIGNSIAATRFTATLLTLSAGLATILAAVGVFGVMAYSVASRTREFGLRIALGARPRDVLHLVLGQGMQAAGIGLAVGLVAAALASRFIAAQLHGVSARDLLTYLGGATLMAAVALAAAWLPARRATRIDPMEALRYE